MTIASEIQDLQTNLQSAKSAVSAKGGTVGDTGLAGLASEISTIPSGGTLDNYGTITYLDGNNVEQTLTLATEEDYIELTLGASGSTIHINNVAISKNKITSVVIADGVQYIPDRFCYQCDALSSVTIPSSVHFIGAYVFYLCSNLTNINFSLQNVLYVGSYFLGSCLYFNSPISLPKVLEIGDYFLYGCSNFNNTITLNDDMQTIGVSFLNGCTNFNQPFTIPSGLIDDDQYVQPIGGQFFYNCNKFVGPLNCTISPSNIGGTTSQMNQFLGTSSSNADMYTTGVTLIGPYAQDWKTRFADRDSSPYRKLIIGS